MFRFRYSEEGKGLAPFVERLPEDFDGSGEVIHELRNVLRVMEYEGEKYNVKRFKVPFWLNRVVYTFFRKSKAERSFLNALMLKENGIGTPMPIAYGIEKSGGLMKRSFYVSRQLEGYKEIRDCYRGPLAGNEEKLRAFARFTARLHEKGILHLDYSPGNILYRREADGTYDFQLVDINRMRRQPVGMKEGCLNFHRMFECDEIYEFLGTEYAAARGFDAAASRRLMLAGAYAFDRKKKRKRKLKRWVGKD